MKKSPSNFDVELGQEISTWTIFFHQEVAERLGLGPGDHKFLMFLMQEQSLTAGELAEQTSLTTGAITGVIDRLERAGFVRREQDPEDKRRVVVRPIHQCVAQIAPLFSGLTHAMKKLNASYTPEQMAVIRDYMSQACAIMKAETYRLRTSRITVPEAPVRTHHTS